MQPFSPDPNSDLNEPAPDLVATGAEADPAAVDGELDSSPAADGSGEPLLDADLPVDEAIRAAAYHRYLARVEAGDPGDEFSDWLEAERAAPRP